MLSSGKRNDLQEVAHDDTADQEHPDVEEAATPSELGGRLVHLPAALNLQSLETCEAP